MHGIEELKQMNEAFDYVKSKGGLPELRGDTATCMLENILFETAIDKIHAILCPESGAISIRTKAKEAIEAAQLFRIEYCSKGDAPTPRDRN